MSRQSDQEHQGKESKATQDISQKKSGSKPAPQFADNRPEAVAQRKLQELADNSPRISQLTAIQNLANSGSQVSQLRVVQEMADSSIQTRQAGKLQAMADMHSGQRQQPKVSEQTVQKKQEIPPAPTKQNNTGLPDNLKSGIESLSGYSMDDVKVHYNSDKPAQLQAHAYAQGTDIHLGSGQEKHLPHEAWHVVQQKQGRVKPTLQMKEVGKNEKEGTRNRLSSTNKHYYFNPAEGSKREYNSQINNDGSHTTSPSSGSTAQLVPIKGWGFYTSSMDTAEPKKHFPDAAAVLTWEATLPAAPAAAPVVDAEAAAPVVDAAAPEAAPVTVGAAMTRHFNDHKDKYLPKNNGALIDYVDDNWEDFAQDADGTNWTLDLGPYNTRRAGGKWEPRDWYIMIWHDTNEIHHFGPLG